MLNFHLIPWWGDYAETHNSNRPKLNGNCGSPENFHTKRLFIWHFLLTFFTCK